MLHREKGRAIIDIRFPVKYTQEEILAAIEQRLNNTGIVAKVLYGQNPLYVPKDRFPGKNSKQSIQGTDWAGSGTLGHWRRHLC